LIKSGLILRPGVKTEGRIFGLAYKFEECEEFNMTIVKESKAQSIDRRRFNVPPPPGPGRPKGLPNKVARTIRAAVETAAREVTTRDGQKGLTAWLLERAAGGIADRQIFAGMVKAALPLKVDATVQSIQINLGWLAARPIDTAGAVIDAAPGTLPAAMPPAIEASHGAEGEDIYTPDEESVDKSMG
jgi:hypothetical protein